MVVLNDKRCQSIAERIKLQTFLVPRDSHTLRHGSEWLRAGSYLRVASQHVLRQQREHFGTDLLLTRAQITRGAHSIELVARVAPHNTTTQQERHHRTKPSGEPAEVLEHGRLAERDG